MKKIILLAALCLATPALAMSTTENIAVSNQPVDPIDLATYNADLKVWDECIFASGKFPRPYVYDANYAPFMKDRAAAQVAARPDYNNLVKFLQYRSSSFARAGKMAPTYGCAVRITPLSMERR